MQCVALAPMGISAGVNSLRLMANRGLSAQRKLRSMQRASLPTFPWLTTTRKRRHSTSFPPLSKRCFRPFLPRFGNVLTSGGLGGGKKKANLPHEGTHRGVDLGWREDRKSVVGGKSGSVRGVLGGRGHMRKKNNEDIS